MSSRHHLSPGTDDQRRSVSPNAAATNATSGRNPFAWTYGSRSVMITPTINNYVYMEIAAGQICLEKVA